MSQNGVKLGPKVKTFHLGAAKIKNNFRRENRRLKSYQDWRSQLSRKYGLTVYQYVEMLQAQDHRCAICKAKQKCKLHVDHDHETGEIRALLCGNCNRVIGLIREDRSRLNQMDRYLLEHGAMPKDEKAVAVYSQQLDLLGCNYHKYTPIRVALPKDFECFVRWGDQPWRAVNTEWHTDVDQSAIR